jgi:histidine triad (HIT) family protein
MEECVFCKIVRGEIPSEKVYEDDDFIAFLDVNPISKGHTLVVPKKHFATILDMPDTLGSGLIQIIKKISLDLIKSKKAEGFNILQSNYGVAQQEVPHIHFHIIPRKSGDGLNLRFK